MVNQRRKHRKGKQRKSRFYNPPARGLNSNLLQRNSMAEIASTPLKMKQRGVLKYQEFLSQNPGVLTASIRIWSANGLFDPDISGVGHQPRGFDQLMALYDHYICIKSAIQVSFYNTDTTNAQIVGISIRDSATTDNPNGYMEGSNCVYTVLGPKGSGNEVKTLKLDCNPNSFLGVSNPLSSDRVRGDIASNPTDQVYFHVWVYDLTAGDSSTVHTSTNLTYASMFVEPKNPSQS